MTIGNDILLSMYRTMIRIRAFEERVSQEYAQGKIRGGVHLYIGEEAIATGAMATLEPNDYILSTHRGHGHLIAKGGKTDRMMAELLGKKTGYCKGKGGSLHIADPDLGMLGANGIVGAGIPIAGGAALSAKLRGTGQVTLCFFGDGASNTSRFHEGINMAAILNLPVIYIVENNLYAATTCIRNSTKITNIADRAVGYNIPGEIIDGNDVIQVYETVGNAVNRARKGKGPSLIECKTYLHRGHFEGLSPFDYKPEKEIEDWIDKDPIPRFRERLIGMGILTKEEADKIKHEAMDEMEAAVKFGEDSPLPSPEETLEDVFA